MIGATEKIKPAKYDSFKDSIASQLENTQDNVDEIEENFKKTEIFIDQGKDLVKDLSKLKNVLADVTNTGLNTTYSEVAQYLIMLLELAGSIGGGLYAYFRWNPKPRKQTDQLEEVVSNQPAIRQPPSKEVLQPQQLNNIIEQVLKALPTNQEQHGGIQQQEHLAVRALQKPLVRGPLGNAYRLRGVSGGPEPMIEN